MFTVRCLACEYSAVPLIAHLHWGGEGRRGIRGRCICRKSSWLNKSASPTLGAMVKSFVKFTINISKINLPLILCEEKNSSKTKERVNKQLY